MAHPYIFGTLVTVIALMGLVIYVPFVMVIVTTRKANRTPFFVVSAWLGVADILGLILFLVYAAPSLYCETNLGGFPVNGVLGSFICIGWFSSLPMIMLLAADRYLCICRPQRYQQSMTKKHATIMAAICAIFGTLYSLPTFTRCCPLYFYYEVASWGWSVDNQGSLNMGKIELGIVIVITTVTFTLNGLVLKELNRIRHQIQPSLSQLQELRSVQRQKKLFIQFFITSIWLIMLDIPFITIAYVPNPSVYLGFYVSLVYLINCSINGWVYFVMNARLRRRMLAMCRIYPRQGRKSLLEAELRMRNPEIQLNNSQMRSTSTDDTPRPRRFRNRAKSEIFSYAKESE